MLNLRTVKIVLLMWISVFLLSVIMMLMLIDNNAKTIVIVTLSLCVLLALVLTIYEIVTLNR